MGGYRIGSAFVSAVAGWWRLMAFTDGNYGEWEDTHDNYFTPRSRHRMNLEIDFILWSYD